MSVTTMVLLDRRRLPSTAAWQAALDGLGVGIVLDPDLDPARHDGHWPVIVEGEASGFELYREDLIGLGADDLASQVGDRDLAVLLVTHGELAELRCALFAAVALTRLALGVIVDEDLEVWPIDAVEAEARTLLD